MASILVDLVFFLSGAAGIGAAVRRWRTGPGGRPVPGWAAVGLYTLAALAFVSPGLLTRGYQVATDIVYQGRPWNETLADPVEPKNPLLSDPPYQMLPFRELVRRRWLAGELPLWADELGTGQPLLANAQSAPFAPLHLPLLALPTLRALTVAVGWQLVLGLLLMHALLIRLGAPPAGAAVAAVAFAFSTFSVVWAYYPMGMTAMWLPGVLLGLVLAAEAAPRAVAGLTVCALGMALSGHPETLAHTALAAAGVALWMLVVRRWRPGERLRFLARSATAGVLAFALAAPFLLPILESLPASERAASLALHPRSERPSDFRPRHLAWLVDPVVAGNPREGGWAGPSNFNEHASFYCGLVTVVLALSGALVVRGRVLAMVVAGGAALAGAFRLDPVHALLTALPGIGEGAHGRLRLFWVLAVTVAAGLSLEPVLRSRAGRRVFAVALVAALVALVGLGAPPPRWLRLWRAGALAGGVALLALPWMPGGWRAPRRVGPLGRSRPHPPRVVAAVVLAALGLDLGLLGIRYNPGVPAELDLSPPPVVAWLTDREREATADPAGPRPFRVLGDEWALFGNVPALYGLWNLRGYDPARPEAPSRFVDRVTVGTHVPGGALQPQRVRAADPATLGYLGVRYVLTRHRAKLPPPAWHPVYNDQGGRVWENAEALPLFFVPKTIESAPDARTALALALEIDDYRARDIVEARDGVEARERVGASPAQAGAQTGSARLTALSANRFDLEVTGPTGAVVVSSVSHDPGWRVRIDGEPAPLLRANSAFLAFRVPAGDHRVTLVYSPRGWRWGLALCAAAVAALVVLRWSGAVGARRRRSDGAPAATRGATPPPAGSTPHGGRGAGSPTP